MSQIELQDELFGFHPGNQGTSAVIHAPSIKSDALVVVATRYAVDFEDDEGGWEWGLGATHLNRQQVIELRDYLNARLEETK